MSEYVLNVEVRTELGKGASRRLRRTDMFEITKKDEEGNEKTSYVKGIPAVVYGAGQDAVSITLRQNEIERFLLDNDFFASEITLSFDDGKTETVTICDLQRHPVKNFAMHADFKRV